MNRYIAIVFLSLLWACTPSSPTPAQHDAGPPPPPPPAVVRGGETPDSTLPPPPPPKPETRTPAQLAQAACQGPAGEWRCPKIRRPLMASGSQPIYPASYSISQWYIDPQNASGCASDSNSGTSQTCGAAGIGPLVTWGELSVHRLGTIFPVYPPGQSVTVNMLSAQPANTDSINFEPRTSNGGYFLLDGRPAWTNLGTFTSGAVGGNLASPVAGGTVMSIASVPGYVVSQVLLNNTTRASYAFVWSVAGGTASMSAPQTVASITSVTSGTPAPVQDADWTAGDSITAYALPNVNLKTWRPVGGDVSSGSQFGAGWVIGVNIPDPSGSGLSLLALENRCAYTAISTSIVSPRLHISEIAGRGNAVYVLGTYMVAPVVSFVGEAQIAGGIVGAGLTGFGGFTLLLNTPIIHGGAATQTGATISLSTNGAWADTSTWVIVGPSMLYGNTPTSRLWGSYSVTVDAGGLVFNNAGVTWANFLLTNGALKFGTNTTGSKYSAGTFTDGISLTPANIDTNGGLQDPVSGARFTISQ